VGEEKLGIFIEKDINVLEAFYFGLNQPPVDLYEKMDQEEAARVERFRCSMARTVVPLLGMARKAAAAFPPDIVEAKITPEWLLSKGQKKFPKLAAVVLGHGEKGRIWLDRQCRQIVDYLLKRLDYDQKSGRLVKVAKKKA
jgi:hypothetical protein